MRVSRLEIFGFKSFLEKLALPLEPGFTAIVGPNGCGKSNVVDALRWVLGESRASTLRGTALEDVIFNGTDALRPLGLAEVTLTLRASESGFFAELSERADGILVPCNLDKSDNAALDSEIPDQPIRGEETARPRLTVISGALDNAAADNTAEETVMGGTIAENPQEDLNEPNKAYDDPSRDSQPSPAAPQEEPEDQVLLKRFAWLKGVQEVQITRRLYRSGESEFFINRVPCRLRDLKELFRAVGLGARTYTVVAQGEVGRIVSSKAEDRRLLIEEAAGVVGFRDKIQTAARRLEETSQNLARINDVIVEVTRQVNSLKIHAARARNRQTLKQRIGEIELKLFCASESRLSEKLEESQAVWRNAQLEVERLEAQYQKASAAEIEGRGGLVGLDVESDSLRARIESLREEMTSRAQRRSGIEIEQREALARLAALRDELGVAAHQNDRGVPQNLEASGGVTKQLEIIRQRIEETLSERERLQSRCDQLEDSLKSKGFTVNDSLRETAILLEKSRELLRESEKLLREKKGALAVLEVKRQALQKQLGRASSASIMNQRQIEASGAVESSGAEVKQSVVRLFDDLEVPEGLIAAVDAVLSEKASYLLSEDDFADLLHKPHSPFEAAGGFVLSSAAASRILADTAGDLYFENQADASSAESCAVPFKPLLSLIKVAPRSLYAVQRLLRGVYYCEDAKAGLEILRTVNRGTDSIRLVTASGQIISDFMLARAPQSSGLIELRAELEDLERQIAGMDASLSTAEEDFEAKEKAVLEVERRHAQLMSDSDVQQHEIRELTGELGTMRGRLETLNQVLSRLESDKLNTEARKDALLSEINNLLSAGSSCDLRLQEFDGEASDRLAEQLSDLKSALSEIEAKRAERRAELGALAEEASSSRNLLDDARRRVSETSLAVERVTMELSSLRQRFRAEYEMALQGSIEPAVVTPSVTPPVTPSVTPPENSVAESRFLDSGQPPQDQEPLFDIDALIASYSAANSIDLNEEEEAELKAELARLKARLLREGEVDSTAIQRLAEEQERLDNLSQQRQDLENASKTLHETIARLTTTSEQRFLSVFTKVSDNFRHLIPRLFGGGKGSLDLTDPAHPLESGVEITVRPPGKKLKSIELMSGGEKALSAIALIISMFLERPSPLCVLDEVDAPLDDANLVRFLSLIKEMSSKTQFLVISHNKQTMSVADRLIGVTMQTPGSSKVVAVSLHEAQAQVA